MLESNNFFILNIEFTPLTQYNRLGAFENIFSLVFVMDYIQKQIFVTVTATFYILSLFFFFPSAKNSYLDLSAAIQQIQKIQQSSVSNQNSFQTALRGSILSLKSIAGLSAVIVKTSHNNTTTDSDSSFVLVLVKLPHILSTSIYQYAMFSDLQDRLMVNSIYKSPAFPPELPPPIFS